MSVRHRVRIDRLGDMADSMRQLDGRSVEVGVFDGEQAWLAGIHEYGCIIPVTPRMRAYLAATGLPLSPATTVITIPERSFLRAGHDEHIDEVLERLDSLASSAAIGDITIGDFLDAVGTEMEGKIKEYAVDLDSPPLHPYTLEHRHSGGTNPLADTGSMIGAITHRVN